MNDISLFLLICLFFVACLAWMKLIEKLKEG
jgi:hypothetical protein